MRASKSEGKGVILDTFEYGSPAFGPEKVVVDYAVLAADRKMDLPTSFTICSSVHMNIMTGPFVFYQLYQDDGKPWFQIHIKTERDTNIFVEGIDLRYDMKQLSGMDTVPIKPNSWYHGCTALHTGTGHMLFVVNGNIVIDQVIEKFINSINEKPKSLEGRLSLFKTYISNGIWYQSRQRLTNLNVHTSALQLTE